MARVLVLGAGKIGVTIAAMLAEASMANRVKMPPKGNDRRKNRRG